jgi:hypothetical protein
MDTYPVHTQAFEIVPLLGLQHLLNKSIHIPSMDFRNIGKKVIATAAALPTMKSVSLFSHDRFCPELARPHGSHEPPDAAADTQDIGLEMFNLHKKPPIVSVQKQFLG